MENKLTEVVDKSSITCTENDVCFTVQNDAIRRVKVLEVKPNEVIVEFIDYGGTATIKKDLLYHLPLTFKKYSSQAICCKLVDPNGCENTQWNNEDFTSLCQYTKNKVWKVKTYRCLNNIYDVSLVNEEGVSLYSIAQSLVEPLADVPESKECSLSKVPSVWSKLKEGNQVTIVATDVDNDKFWGILDDGSGFSESLTEIENLLLKVDTETEDINMYCEEGDLAVGFSNEFQQYFRCVVLKRLHSSFLVFYIDYGNKEEITKLRSVFPAILQKQSYVVCCTKPDSLSIEVFKQIFQKCVKMCVAQVKTSVVELQITDPDSPLSIKCFPLDHNISNFNSKKTLSNCEQPTSSKCNNLAPKSSLHSVHNIKNNENEVEMCIRKTSPVPPIAGNTQKVCEKVMKSLIPDKELAVGVKYNVNIIGIKSIAEMYVRLNEDEQRASSFYEQFNQYCTSETSPKYIPIKDEVVCCKYSKDNNWYRAQVLEASENKFKVHYIDYGDEEIVSVMSIKPLPKRFVCTKFCICVSLINVKMEDPSKLFTKLLQEGWIMEVKEATKPVVKVELFQGQKSLLEFIEVNNKPYNIPIVPTIVTTEATRTENPQAVLKTHSRTENPQNPSLSSLKKQLLPLEKEVEVIFCYVEQDIFYAQMITSQDLIANLESKLKNAATFIGLSGLPKEGDVVCAKFTDGVFYRGTVKEVCNDQKTCTILFIDYGNSERIALEDLKMLPEALCTFPILAVPVKFTNIEELQNQLQANLSVFKVKAKNSDNIQLVELVVPGNDVELSSIATQVLPSSLTEVVVSHKEEGLVYVQKQSDLAGLQEMTNFFHKDGSLQKISSPKVGQLLCVKYDDGFKYRGMIKSKFGDGFKAFFVDYGNTSSVTDIYSLNSKYSSLPMYCIPVIIENEKDLSCPVNIDSCIKIKYTGKTMDNIQVVKVCPLVKTILLSSLKTSSLEESFEAYFHSFDGKYYYLTKAVDSTKINEMKSVMANFIEDEIYHLPTVGEILLVKYDKEWQRVCVQKLNENLKECEVFLVDLGKTKTVSFSNLSYIPTNIASFHIFLVKVSLSSVDSKETISFEKCYTLTVLDDSEVVPVVQVLQRYMFTSLKRKTLPLNEERNVVFVYKENDILFVQDVNDAVALAETQADARKCASSKAISYNPMVGELFCSKSNADGDFYRCCIEEVVDSNKYKIHFIDFGNSEVVTKGNLRCLPSSLAMQPSYGIAVKIVDQSPVTLEVLYSVVALSEPQQNVQSVKLVDLPKLTEPESKFLFSSCQRVSFTPGEQDVAIYNVGENDEALLLFCTPFDEKNIVANMALTEDLTEYCQSLKCSSYNGDSMPKEDEMVLAKFNEDCKWYRAVVIECSEPYYEVVFIDFGNNGQLHKDSLRKMEEKFMSLEIQAILCSLTGFESSVENLPIINKELNNFTIFNSPAPLKAIVSFDEEDDIAIEIPQITNYLMEKKLVVPKKL